jgi:hypothetical protein
MLAIYARVIYTAPRIMFLMRADTLLYKGKWEGVGPWKSRVFLGPVKWHQTDRRVPFGPKKLPIFDSFWGKVKKGGKEV